MYTSDRFQKWLALNLLTYGIETVLFLFWFVTRKTNWTGVFREVVIMANLSIISQPYSTFWTHLLQIVWAHSFQGSPSEFAADKNSHASLPTSQPGVSVLSSVSIQSRVVPLWSSFDIPLCLCRFCRYRSQSNNQTTHSILDRLQQLLLRPSKLIILFKKLSRLDFF